MDKSDSQASKAYVFLGKGTVLAGQKPELVVSPEYYHRDDHETGQDDRDGEMDDKCLVSGQGDGRDDKRQNDIEREEDQQVQIGLDCPKVDRYFQERTIVIIDGETAAQSRTMIHSI